VAPNRHLSQCSQSTTIRPHAGFEQRISHTHSHNSPHSSLMNGAPLTGPSPAQPRTLEHRIRPLVPTPISFHCVPRGYYPPRQAAQLSLPFSEAQ